MLKVDLEGIHETDHLGCIEVDGVGGEIGKVGVELGEGSEERLWEGMC
jgi:hypothetical protein